MMSAKSCSLTRFAKRTVAAALLMTAAANANAIAFTFTSITEELLDSQATSFVGSAFTFDMTNDTGQVWNDFHLRAEGDGDIGALYPFMRLSDYVGPGTAAFLDNNGDSVGYTEALTIDNLNIVDGDTLSFDVSIFGGALPEGMTAYRVYGLPSVDDNGNGQVPVPATLALLGLGLAGIGYQRRKQVKAA